MFYGGTVAELRLFFLQSWQKHQQKESLTALEQQIVAVLLEHPEYHPLFNSAETLDKAYFPALGESNPFFHLGLHLAIRDQIQLDRPAGISKVYQQLLAKLSSTMATEHLMMEQLAECLWQAQQSNTPPDEQTYLASLENLLNS